MVLYTLEVLSTIAVSLSNFFIIFISAYFLVKNIQLKISGIKINDDIFIAQKKIFSTVKLCGRCGFVFQFLAWLMFSTKQKGFIELSRLTYIFALLYASICLLVIVLGIICRILNKNEQSDFLKERIISCMINSALYFIVTFLIA